MLQVDEVQKDVQRILEAVRACVDEVSNLPWKTTDGYFTLILRSILRRQFDSLDTISYLVSEEKGFATGPLLRPSCEELIWTKYLTSIPSKLVEQLIVCSAQAESLRSLRAQYKAAGRDATNELGLLHYYDEAKKRESERRRMLRILGRELRWPEKNIKDGELPSVSWLAKRAGERETYELIYHATSRFVHFSPHELLRRAWGNPFTESMSITSKRLESYWGHFSLHWGLLLFLRTSAVIFENLDGQMLAELDAATVLATAERIGKIGRPPIITAEELEWPV